MGYLRVLPAGDGYPCLKTRRVRVWTFEKVTGTRYPFLLPVLCLTLALILGYTLSLPQLLTLLTMSIHLITNMLYIWRKNSSSHCSGHLGKIIPRRRHELCRAHSINLIIANCVDFSSFPPSIASKQRIIYTKVSLFLFKLSKKLTISPTALTFLYLWPLSLLNQLHALFEVRLRRCLLK